MLKQLVSVFPQIIIVSHDEYVKDSFDHAIVVEEDSESNSVFYWKKNDIGANTWNKSEVKEIVSKNYN